MENKLVSKSEVSPAAQIHTRAAREREKNEKELVILRSPIFSSDFDQPSSRSIHLLPSQRVKKVGISSGNIIDCLTITISEDGISGKEMEVRLNVCDRLTDSLLQHCYFGKCLTSRRHFSFLMCTCPTVHSSSPLSSPRPFLFLLSLALHYN